MSILEKAPVQTIFQLFFNGILLGGIYALITMGLTLIFGVMKIINFSHGEFLMVSMYGTFWLFHLLGIHPYLSIFIIVPIMFIVGLITQRSLIQRLIDAPEIAQIFVTVGLSIALQNGILFLWSADYRGIKTPMFTKSLVLGGVMLSYSRLIVFGTTVGLMLFLLFFLKYTYVGKAMRATSQSWKSAWLMGVNIHRIYLLAFAIGSACVGLAGAMIIPIYSVFPTVGSYFVLIAFVVVVLGGMGDILGAFFAGLIVGLIETFSGFFLAPALGPMAVFVLFVLILLFKPSGLMGRI